MKTFFILWFTLNPSNFGSLTTLKFDTWVECMSAGKAMVKSYNNNKPWVSPDLEEVDTFRCIEVK